MTKKNGNLRSTPGQLLLVGGDQRGDPLSYKNKTWFEDLNNGIRQKKKTRNKINLENLKTVVRKPLGILRVLYCPNVHDTTKPQTKSCSSFTLHEVTKPIDVRENIMYKHNIKNF
jgi:hypothetical protein